MLQVHFIMISVIHKIIVSLEITKILKCFLRSVINFHFLKKQLFSRHIMIESLRLEEEKIIKSF